MKIEKLSIADLKAAYDFVLIDLKNLEDTVKQKGVSAQDIPAYSEVKEMENLLYNELLNNTRNLER